MSTSHHRRGFLTRIAAATAVLTAVLCPAGTATGAATFAPTPAAASAAALGSTALTASAPLAPSAPAATTDSTGTRYTSGRSAAVGQLFTNDTTCTATVVGSGSGRVLVTAAHCVFVPTTGPFAQPLKAAGHKPGWVTLREFVPGRSGNATPYGRWPLERAWVDSRWQETGDPRYDVAFVRVGRDVQKVVGSQSIGFGAAVSGQAMTALGYPGQGAFDGRSLRRCATPGVTVSVQDGALQMPCAMTPGVSGGPWMTDFDSRTGTGRVVAVTSYQSGPSTLSAIPLSPQFTQLYRAADAG